MKHTLDSILGACGLIKKIIKKGVSLTSYPAYEPPDGVKINYEVNAKGPFIIHVEIDREAITDKPVPKKDTGPIVLQLKKLEVKTSQIQKIPMLKRTFLHTTGIARGAIYVDYNRLDRPEFLYSFFQFMGYEAPRTPKEFTRLVKQITKSKPGRFYFLGEIRYIHPYSNLRLNCRVSKPEVKK